MAKPVSKISQTLKDLGELKVTEWELPEILRKDVSELEIGRSLRRLGNLQVTEWELRDLVPALQKLGQKEIDIAGFLKRTAEYKVTEWDIREALLKSWIDNQKLSKKQVAAIGNQLKGYLQFLVEQLVDEPNYASIQYEVVDRQVLRFRIILKQRDMSMLIGMNGYVAGPIRRILKDTAMSKGVYALLRIQSHEEAARQDAADEAR